MNEVTNSIVNQFFNSKENSFAFSHPELRKIKPSISVCRIDVERDIEIKNFNIRLPMILDYIDSYSELSFENGRLTIIKNDNDYFLKDDRVESCQLTRKDYKLGFHYLLKGMPIEEKDIMVNILREHLGKSTLYIDDWYRVNDDLFECFMLSSNKLSNFVDFAPNLYKMSLELKNIKEKFEIKENGAIHILNFESVLKEFIENFLNIKF
jgi:hypothetical protein